MELFYQEYFKLLQSLHTQMEAVLQGLPQQAVDWVPGKDMNSLGVLTAHTAGSERFLVGDVVMGEPSGRDRSAEFMAKELTADQLILKLQASLGYIKTALEKLRLEDLQTLRHARDGRELSVAWCLVHALEHAAQHLGHMQITRQMWEMR